MPLSDTIKTLIRNAWEDGYPCLVATYGPAGPNISPKGSMIVFDDAHLAYWERSKRTALENLSHDKRVCVMYSNFKAQRDGVLESGFCVFSASSRCTRAAPCARRFLPNCCPANRPMPAPTPASARCSKSSGPSMSAASRLSETTLIAGAEERHGNAGLRPHRLAAFGAGFRLRRGRRTDGARRSARPGAHYRTRGFCRRE